MQRESDSATSQPRRAIVTGAASGIGMAVADLMRREGAQVIGFDRVAIPEWQHGESLLAVDVTDPSAVEAGVEEAVAVMGGLDVLVAAAGMSRRGTAEETPPDVWDEVFALNAKAPYLCARAAVKHLRSGDAAAIVNVGSQFGLIASKGYVAYCASKAALIHLTRAMAVDHGPEGIRVNAVCPGPTETPMLDANIKEFADPAGAFDAMVGRTLHGRLSQPGEIAEIIAFLASERASSVHGAIVVADAGYSIH
jgi:meso-butanediol dehydrogenase/(S,S)-butanediol dehydrogenase/diacetyl reductase